MGAWGDAVWIAGPRASFRWAWRTGSPRYGLEFASWSGVPATEEELGAGAALWPSALRAAFFVEHSITRRLGFGAALGVWAGLLRVSAEVSDRELRAGSAIVRFHAGLRAALGVRVHVSPRLSLVLEPVLDLTPFRPRFGVQRVSGFDSILSVASVRPGAALLIALDF